MASQLHLFCMDNTFCSQNFFPSVLDPNLTKFLPPFRRRWGDCSDIIRSDNGRRHCILTDILLFIRSGQFSLEFGRRNGTTRRIAYFLHLSRNGFLVAALSLSIETLPLLFIAKHWVCQGTDYRMTGSAFSRSM